MAVVQLYQRRGTPPARVGAIKPPHIPEVGVGEFVAGLVGKFLDSPIWKKIEKTRTNNEQSEILGNMDTLLVNFETELADEPGLPAKDIQKKIDKVLSEIDKAPKLATTPEAKEWVKNLILKNRGKIEATLNKRAEGIETQHELKRFQLERERLIAERKPDELNTLYEGISGTIIDPEVATLAFQNDVMKIDALQAKFDAQVAKEAELATRELEEAAEAQLFIDIREQAMTFKILEEAQTFIDSQSAVLERVQRNDIHAQVKRKFGFREAEIKEQTEQQQKKDRQGILNLFIANNYVNIDDSINATSLDPEEKEGWISKADRRAKAFNKDEIDPFLLTEPKTYFELRRRIAADPQSVTENELAKAVGDGISINDYEKLLNMIQPEEPDKPPNPLNAPAAKRAQASLGRVRAAEIAITEKEDLLEIRATEDRYLRVQNDLDRAILDAERAGKPLTDEQIEKKTRELTTPIIKEVTLNWFQRWTLPKKPSRFFPKTEAIFLTEKRIENLRKQPVFDRFTPAEQQQVIDLIKAGSTVEQAVSEIETPLPRITTQAEYDALPSGAEAIDSDGTRFRKK